MAYPSPTKTYHRDAYPAISPELEQLSTKGKNIVVTGGGAGIGLAIATAFARSKAATITLLGRTEQTLKEAKAKLEHDYRDTTVYYVVADIVNKGSLEAAFTEIGANIGKIHVLVANAGFLSELGPIQQAELNEWFMGFEVNIKGNFNLIQAFLPLATPDAALINVTTGIIHADYIPGYSSYHSSKLASAKIFDYVHYEHPGLFVLNVHPGIHETTMTQKSRAKDSFPFDNVQLPAEFIVWAVSPEARFLNGKVVWAHWDVGELKSMEKEIRETNKFTLGLLGWP